MSQPRLSPSPSPGGRKEGGSLGRNRISMPQLPQCFFSHQLEAGEDSLGEAQLHGLGFPTFQDQQQVQQQSQEEEQQQSQEEEQQQEGSDRSFVGYGEDERRVRGRVEGWVSGQGPGKEVGAGVRASRPSAGKDRHSKVHTSKGPRDRRVRLSVHTATQFYDVQDRLGYDQPSKAVEWLIRKAKGAIDELAHLPNHPPPASASATAPPSQSASVPAPTASQPPFHSPKTDPAAAAAATATIDVRTESRLKARERARERAREKEARDRDRDREQQGASASFSASVSTSDSGSQTNGDCGVTFPSDALYHNSGHSLKAPVVRTRQLSGGPLGGVTPVLPSAFCSTTLGLVVRQERQQQQQPQQSVVEGLAAAKSSVAASASAAPVGAHCLWDSSIPCLDAQPTRPLHESPVCSSMGPLQSTPVPHATYVSATLFAPSRGGSLQPQPHPQPHPVPHFHQDGSEPPRHA